MRADTAPLAQFFETEPHFEDKTPASLFRRRSTGMDKKAMREEADRLMREAMAKKSLVVKQGDTRILAVCGKCGAPNKTKAPKGVARVKSTCKECGHTQATL